MSTEVTEVHHIRSYEVVDLTAPSPKQEETETNIKVKPKKISIDSDYARHIDNPQPGDLVLATLGEIGHPAKNDPDFGPRFLIIGAVVGFTPMSMRAIEAWKKGVPFKKYAKR